MHEFDPVEFGELIASVDSAASAHDKGERFENLCAYLFGLLAGVEIQARDANMAAEEIDLVLWNAQVEDVLRPWDGVITVECKNWSAAVGAPALDSFIGKIRRRSLTHGIFIAANGVTGTYENGGDGGAVEIIRAALQEGMRVITLTMDDIRAIGSADDFRRLIKRRYCGLFVHKILND